MLVLELFAGNGSIGRAFEKLGWGVVSLDICAKFKPTLVVDILQWDYTCFPRDYFQFVWASPVCTEFSRAKTVGVRDLEGADKLVARALEIFAYFSTANWAFENPQSGLLKTRDHLVKGLPYYDTSYCRYGFCYRKHTRIWTNLVLCLRKPCSLQDPCTAMVGRRHLKTAQQSRRGSDPNDHNNTCSQAQLYSIPPGLCDDIARAANASVRENDGSSEGAHAPSPVRQI